LLIKNAFFHFHLSRPASKSQKAEILFVFSDSSINGLKESEGRNSVYFFGLKHQRPQRRKEKVRKSRYFTVFGLDSTVNFADQKCFFSLSFVEAGLKKSEGRNSVCFFGLKHQPPQRRKEKVILPFLAWTVNFADQKCFFSLSFVEAGLKN
jgi:hypothetical protein